MMIGLLSALTLVTSALDAFLARPEPGYRWQRTAEEPWSLTVHALRWRGIDWSHRVVVIWPSDGTSGDLAYLHITGGTPNERDFALMRTLADRSGLPVAGVFDMPNQPLMGGLREDALIAHTFLRYLEDGDPDWPLLLPMTKGAIRSMDAIVAATAEAGRPLRRFIVNGASKRGWTTWLVGATRDPRVIGLAPMVYDNLNIPAQMARQIATFDGYSEQISDYTSLDLPSRVNTPEGRRLVEIVDPYAYRERIRVPVLILNGANDPYWPVDALSLYWPALTGPKSALVVPNAGHDLGDGRMAMAALSEFGRRLAEGRSMPRIEWTWHGDGLTVAAPEATRLRLWLAEADRLDFRASMWRVAEESNLQEYRFELPARTRSSAAFVEVQFGRGARGFSLTTDVRVFPAH